jgi:hypothetical protein
MPFARCFLALAATLSCVSACTSASDACTATGNALVTVNVDGLPVGVLASITASGGGSGKSGTALATTQGSNTFTGAPVVIADPIVRTVYTAQPLSACITGDMAVTLTYAAVPTSGKLWVGNATGGTAPFLGFASASILTSGAPAATIAADTTGSGGFAFDKAGNVWIVGGTTADAPLARYTAADFATSGAKTPDVVVSSPAFEGGFPGLTALAFDAGGDLWGSIKFSSSVVRLPASDLAATGTVQPSVTFSKIAAPAGLAFDSAGNLWIACDEGVMEFTAARLNASSGAADLILRGRSGSAVTTSLGAGISVAFDTANNLWVGYDGSIAKYTPADRDNSSGSLEKTIIPSILIGADVQALPVGIAFDESGSLWVAGSQGRILRLGADVLTGNGSAAAAVIASPDVGYAQWLGIWPAPKGLPLFHAMP